MKTIRLILFAFFIFSCEKNNDEKFNCIENFNEPFPLKFYHYIPNVIKQKEIILINDTLVLFGSFEFQQFKLSYQNDSIVIQMELCNLDGNYIIQPIPKQINSELMFNKKGTFKLFNLLNTKNNIDSLSFVKNLKVE